MNRGRLIGLLLGLAALLAVGVCFPPATHAAPQDLLRLSGEFKNFDGSETSRTWYNVLFPVFDKSVVVPAGMTALYITISATGDTHNWKRYKTVLDLRCSVNWLWNCHASGFLLGLNELQKQVTNREDNAVYHTWCKRISPSSEDRLMSVQIWMVPDPLKGSVDLEAAHLFIDASDLAVNACNELNTQEPDGF